MLSGVFLKEEDDGAVEKVVGAAGPDVKAIYGKIWHIFGGCGVREPAGRFEGGVAGKRAENEWKGARLQVGLLVEVRRYRGKGMGKAVEKSHRVMCIKKVGRSMLYMAVGMRVVDRGLL